MKWFKNLPPLATRLRMWNPRKAKTLTIVKEVCILPLGAGLWIPYRNVTADWARAEKALSNAESHVKSAKAAYEAATDSVNREIDCVGLHVENVLRMVEGEYQLVSTNELVNLRIPNRRGAKTVVETDTKPKVKKEVIVPNIVTTPRRKGGNNGGNNNKNNGNN